MVELHAPTSGSRTEAIHGCCRLDAAMIRPNTSFHHGLKLSQLIWQARVDGSYSGSGDHR